MCSAISSYRSACSASFAKYTFCSRASTIVQNELLRTRNRKPAKAGPYNPSISTQKISCRTVSDAESSSVLRLKLYSQRCRQRYSSPTASDAANDADSLRGTRQPHGNPSATHPELSRVHLKAQPVRYIDLVVVVPTLHPPLVPPPHKQNNILSTMRRGRTRSGIWV